MGGGDDETFKKINDAYGVLSDDEKRREYDNPNKSFESFFSGSNQGDFMDDFFGRRGRQFRGSDVKIDVTISVKHSIMGGEQEITYNRMAQDFSEERRSIKINIHRGVDDGNIYRVSGGGNHGEGKYGDLLVVINIGGEGEKYEKSGLNLIYTVDLNPVEILTGKEVTVDLFESVIKVKIPKCVDVNKHMRVKGKGFKWGNNTGDLYLKFKVITPTGLTDYEWDLINNLSNNGENFRN